MKKILVTILVIFLSISCNKSSEANKGNEMEINNGVCSINSLGKKLTDYNQTIYDFLGKKVKDNALSYAFAFDLKKGEGLFKFIYDKKDYNVKVNKVNNNRFVAKNGNKEICFDIKFEDMTYCLYLDDQYLGKIESDTLEKVIQTIKEYEEIRAAESQLSKEGGMGN